MSENLADVLVKLADVLHWMGKYDEGNAAVLLSRLLRVREISSLDELEEWVTREENESR